jgi:hypothetical protein
MEYPPLDTSPFKKTEVGKNGYGKNWEKPRKNAVNVFEE